MSVTASHGQQIYKEDFDGKTYYDLIDANGEMPYSDGQACEVLEKTSEYVKLKEVGELIPFILSAAEYKAASMPCRG